MSHLEQRVARRERETWRSVAELEQSRIGSMNDGDASPDLLQPPGHRERRESQRDYGTGAGNRNPDEPNIPTNEATHPFSSRDINHLQGRPDGTPAPDSYTNDTLPNEPPPSYEESQAQAEAQVQVPEQSFQNLSLQSPSRHRHWSSNTATNALNSQHYDRQAQSIQNTTPSNQLSPSGTLAPDSTQPSSALLKHALQFAEQYHADEPSSSALSLRQPILIPSLPTSVPPFSFPITHPSSLPRIPPSIFHTFLTNLNILLSLSHDIPSLTTSVSDPLVRSYLSHLNTTLFHSHCHRVSLVTTKDLVHTLFAPHPSVVEVLGTIRAEADLRAGHRVTGFEDWAEIVQAPAGSPAGADPSEAVNLVSADDKPSSEDTKMLLELRDRVREERRGAVLLAPHASAAGSSSREAGSGPTLDTRAEGSTAGDREVDRALEGRASSSRLEDKSKVKATAQAKAKAKAKLSHDDSDADPDSASSSSSSSSSRSSSHKSKAKAKAKEKDQGRDRGKRREERKAARRKRKFVRRLGRIERRAERALRRGRKEPERVEREKVEAIERLEAWRRRWAEKGTRRGRQVNRGVKEGGRNEDEDCEGKEVLWLVIQNEEIEKGGHPPGLKGDSDHRLKRIM
ncbi:MAG: hypothetical protein M1822_009594 [Bathelium mastoideum]|nr:MAG: hypothetical protein M1822_009594 [Bathelium mastoideum]